jgi:phosphotransferase system  glucose/maltose/N-acetylglucosamine-specific IIC component
MMKFIKSLAQNTKGAMDKILVTLLLVVIGVGLVVGLNTWMTEEMNTVKDSATNKIGDVITETTTN